MTDEVESWLAGAGPPPGERLTLAPDAVGAVSERAPMMVLHAGMTRADGSTPLHVDGFERPADAARDDLDLPILQSVRDPAGRPLTPGLERLRLVNQVITIRADVLETLAGFEDEVRATHPEFSGRVRTLRARLEKALAGERWCICAVPLPEGQPVRVCPEHPAEVAEHVWQEYNAGGNTCHYPGCRRTEDEHPAAAGVAG